MKANPGLVGFIRPALPIAWTISTLEESAENMPTGLHPSILTPVVHVVVANAPQIRPSAKALKTKVLYGA
jgi:hypothetical protein